MIASVTELNLKNLWSLVQFIPHAIKSKVQTEKAIGNISVRVGSAGLLAQRTLTVWENEKAMRNYVKSGAHLEAMKAFSKVANTSYTAHYDVTEIPSWEEAIAYLRANGKAL